MTVAARFGFIDRTPLPTDALAGYEEAMRLPASRAKERVSKLGPCAGAAEKEGDTESYSLLQQSGDELNWTRPV